MTLSFGIDGSRLLTLFGGKTVNLRQKIRYVSLLETSSETKIATENGTVLRINTALKISYDLGKVFHRFLKF
jgi:hypothetical protein